MPFYTCKRCGYETSYLQCMRKHLDRKNPCKSTFSNIPPSVLINEIVQDRYDSVYKCKHCKKEFTSAQSKYQHSKKCKESKPQIGELISTIEDLRREIENLKKTPRFLNTGDITNNNIQINIRDFGHENISYLPTDFLTSCFVNKDMVGLLSNLYCDKDHPENHNVRIRSLKRNLIETRVENRWIVQDEDDALTESIRNGYRILVRHAHKHKEEIISEELDSENEYYQLKQWLEEVYDSKREQKPIKRKLLLLLLSNQTILLGKDEEDV